MRLRDACTTIFLAGWTVFWLVFSLRQVLLGYIKYNTRRGGGATYTVEEHPVAFYTLLALNVVCVLLGVLMTYFHIRSALRDARYREDERQGAAKRQAERREKRQKFQPMADEQKASLIRRARKRQLVESRNQKGPSKKG